MLNIDFQYLAFFIINKIIIFTTKPHNVILNDTIEIRI